MPATRTPQDRRPRKTATKKTAPSEESKFAPTTWGSGGIGQLTELTVPTGQLCLVRRPGTQGLLEAGILHNVDSLTALVNTKHVRRVKGKEEINVESLMSDPENVQTLMHTIDRIVCYVVVKPDVHMTPNDITQRDPEKIYADMIDIEDKMFIMNFAVGGTRDLERFRGELADAVGSVAPSERTRRSAK
jgi:hypothetical protein